ncbi:hypothetical protein [Leifsonia xyli]|uniref:hypothetical protein n=1 Tax=Leifsonia xyli TaxID=1575 RepID=UPI003D67134B
MVDGLGLTLNVAIGLVTGVASALASWWMLTRLLRPKLEWRAGVARYRLPNDPEEKFRYQVAIDNPSRRDAVDVNLTLRLRLPNVVRQKSVEVLPLKTESIPIVGSKKAVRSRIRFEMVDDETRRRFATLLPEPFREQWAAAEPIDLKELMLAVPGSSLTVWAFGSDRYTWARAVASASFAVGEIRDVNDARELPRGAKRRRADRQDGTNLDPT